VLQRAALHRIATPNCLDNHSPIGYGTDMTDKQRRIVDAISKMPLPALIQGNQYSIAEGVSGIINEDVTYVEVAAALDEEKARKK